MPLPPAFLQDGVRFEHVVIQARRAPTDFDVVWLDESTEAAALGDETRTQRVDVVAEGGQITAPLAIKVVYCQNADGCGRGAGGPEIERWYEVERAFYTGAYTFLRLPLDVAPIEQSTEPEIFARCEVGGCGSDLSSTAPERGCIGGRHLCE